MMDFIDCYFIKAVDHDLILVDYYSSYKWISFEDFKKNGGVVIFVNENRLWKILEVFPEIDGYNTSGLNIRSFAIVLDIED